MRFKWIAAIWTKQNDASTGFQGTDHFKDRGVVILYVFNHLMAEDQVKRPGRKREGLTCCVEDILRIYPCLSGAFEVILQANYLTTQGRKMFYIHAHTTAVFKDTPFDTITRCFSDHFQPALLSRPPNIGWLAP